MASSHFSEEILRKLTIDRMRLRNIIRWQKQGRHHSDKTKRKTNLNVMFEEHWGGGGGGKNGYHLNIMSQTQKLRVVKDHEEKLKTVAL